MVEKKLKKLSISLTKFFMPLIFKFFFKLKTNRRVINFLSEKSYFSNQLQDFREYLTKLLKDKKIIALDVGAQGGFNSDEYFPKKYNTFFENILVEPLKNEASKLNKGKYLIDKGLWSEKKIKNLYILGNRTGSTSMFEPNEDNFDIHNIKPKDYEDYKVTDVVKIECDTINNLLSELNIRNIDYLKIDTQGAELDIIKGLGNFRPLLIKVEAHIFSMYKNVPSWYELLNYLHKLNYIAIDLKAIGRHNTRLPAEADMLFIPDFTKDEGKKLISESKEKFLSLLLIFGQINLMKIIMKKMKINIKDLAKIEDFYFN